MEKLFFSPKHTRLKEFSKWKEASLRLLKIPRNIDIFKLLEEYQTSANQFYKWFYDEMEKIFKELAEFDELANSIKHIMKNGEMLNQTNLGDWDAPQLEERIVCISDDYILSSQISSCFNNRDVFYSP